MKLTSAQLRYITAVYKLSQDNRGVRPSEIAFLLDVARPSVTRMLNLLESTGLLHRNPEGRVYLTEDGLTLSRKYRDIVDSLTIRLEMAMELTPEAAEDCALLLLSEMPGNTGR